MNILMSLLFLANASATQPSVPSPWALPAGVERCVGKIHDVQASSRINPFYLRADIDGDGKSDYVVLVSSLEGGKNGIALCLARNSTPVVLGAGREFHGMKNLDFDAWMIFEKKGAERGVGEGLPPQLRGEAIEVIWEESASALLYWDGKEVRWYQQGD